MMNVKSKEKEGTTFYFTLPLDNLKKQSESIQEGMLIPKANSKSFSIGASGKFENRTVSNPNKGMIGNSSLFLNKI